MTFQQARIAQSTRAIAEEVVAGRLRAHEKHGDQSIEAIEATDLRWLSILVEEVGETAHELTYDAQRRVDVYSGEPLPPAEQRKRHLEELRKELLDVATVAVAWIASIDLEPGGSGS